MSRVTWIGAATPGASHFSTSARKDRSEVFISVSFNFFPVGSIATSPRTFHALPREEVRLFNTLFRRNVSTCMQHDALHGEALLTRRSIFLWSEGIPFISSFRTSDGCR
jgi:hypothetical protein